MSDETLSLEGKYDPILEVRVAPWFEGNLVKIKSETYNPHEPSNEVALSEGELETILEWMGGKW